MVTFDLKPPVTSPLQADVEALQKIHPDYQFTILDYGWATEGPSIEVRRAGDTGPVAHWLLISRHKERIENWLGKDTA